MDSRIIGYGGRNARPARKRPAFSGQNPITDRANQPSKNDSAVHDSVKTLPIEQFVGLALFRIVLVEIRVKHPHQLLPKLFQPCRLFRVEFPFPLQRRRRGIVFTILLRTLALIVADRRSGGFLAFRQQVLNEGFSKMALSKGIVLVLDYRDRPLRRPLRFLNRVQLLPPRFFQSCFSQIAAGFSQFL